MGVKGTRYGPIYRACGLANGRGSKKGLLAQAVKHDRDLDRLHIRPSVQMAMDREARRAKRRLAEGVDFRETYLTMLRTRDARLQP